jgi:hypothetical protein
MAINVRKSAGAAPLREAPNDATTIGRGNTRTLVTAAGTGPAEVVAAESDVDTKHPDYEAMELEWQRMRATHAGTDAVKALGAALLPVPEGFKLKDKPQAVSEMYADYVMRARFPEVVAPTVMGMVGVIHRMEAKIEMPEAMNPLWENSDGNGLPLEAFHRQITFELLQTGRYGIIVDADLEGSDIPFMRGYIAESLINWDTNFFVLDESGITRNGFKWTQSKKWRVLSLNGGQYEQQVYEGERKTPGLVVLPTTRGNKALTEVPFVVIGTRHLTNDVDKPPLVGVANAAIAAYQLSADYRYQLYHSGQETLFCFNMDPPEAIGAGAIVTASASSKDSAAPDAKYVGPECTGIDAHKVAIADELDNAARAGARLFDQQEANDESGEAKRIRYAAETATLTSIAQTSAQGLERALRFVAKMMGLDPEQVIVTPDLSFVNTNLTPQQIDSLIKAWQAGAISYETLFENLQSGEVINAEKSAEDEQKLIIEEDDADLERVNDPAREGMIREGGAPAGPIPPEPAAA